MASIKQLDERRYKITVSNGYRPNGKKISKAKTIQVPPGVPKRGIGDTTIKTIEMAASTHDMSMFMICAAEGMLPPRAVSYTHLTLPTNSRV